MTTAESVTTFILQRDIFETPLGTFDTREAATGACERSDFSPQLCITRKVETARIADLIKALNAYCGTQAEEYDFCVSPSIQYPHGRPKLADTGRLPERFRHFIAYAVEGGNEGYYVHVGVILSADGPEDTGALPASPYVDLGFCKTYSAESAYAIAREAQRFLTAALWN